MGLASPLPLLASRARLVLFLVLALGGCSPEIGDPCTTSTDCSQNGDRLCDISQPGGYCFIFNCEPAGSNPAAKCPDEAACVAFNAEASPVEGCANALGSTPYTRSYCLKKCDNGDDCRSGYVCVDVETAANGAGSHYFSAVNVDGRSKVCIVAFSSPPPAPNDDASSQVCSGTSQPPEGAGGEGPDSGTAGAGGMSGG
jgi:hypothetical protein